MTDLIEEITRHDPLGNCIGWWIANAEKARASALTGLYDLAVLGYCLNDLNPAPYADQWLSACVDQAACYEVCVGRLRELQAMERHLLRARDLLEVTDG